MPNFYADPVLTFPNAFAVSGTGTFYGGSVSATVKQEEGIHPQLYFSFIKKKFGVLETMKLNNRLKKLEKAFNDAVDNGQSALGEKLLNEVAREARESAIYAKGVKFFIEYDDLVKHKRNIRGGHISDTKFEEFTRVIPKDVLKKKKAVDGVFDGYVIYHYWNEAEQEKVAKKQKMDPEEKSKMRDPVLFGWVKESTRMYFIADWEDEFCDLTFDEIVDVIGKDEDEIRLTREPKLKAE